MPQAVADSSDDVGGHCGFGLTWETQRGAGGGGSAALSSYIYCKKKRRSSSSFRTCREGELNLLVDNLHGNKVVFLVEAAVVEQQTVGFFGGKSGMKKKNKT